MNYELAGHTEMSKKLKIAVIASVLFFLICLSTVFIIKDEFLFKATSDILTIIISSVAAVSILYTFRLMGFKSKEGKVWILLTVGGVFSALGEILWFYYEIILNTQPYPSMADLAYLSGYIFLIAGISIGYFSFKEALRKKDIIIAAILNISLMFFLLYFILVPIYTDPSYDFSSKIASYSYTAGDFLLVLMSSLLFFSFRGAKMSKSWLVILAALVMWALTDSLFTYLDWTGLYEGIPLALTNLGYLISYIFLAFGAYYHKLILKGEA